MWRSLTPGDLDVIGDLFIRGASALLYWYLFVSTGSIWPAVANHALDNSTEIFELQLALVLVTAVTLLVLRRRHPYGTAPPAASQGPDSGISCSPSPDRPEVTTAQRRRCSVRRAAEQAVASLRLTRPCKELSP
ncbi:MAG: hypothetical protein ACRCYR_14050 [Phycicoccus sp.]